MIINEIDAALARFASYEEKVALFSKYAKNAALLHTFKTRKDRQARELLDSELKKLRWRPGISLVQPKKKKLTEEERLGNLDKIIKGKEPILPGRGIIPIRVKNKFIKDDLPEEKRLYPVVIEKAIQNRQKAVNQREKAGRKLIEEADLLMSDQRAELIKIQKDHHKMVMAATAVINTWKQTGALPPAGKSLSEISEEESADLEKEWTATLRNLSRAKASLENWSKKDNQKKVDFYNEKIDKLNHRLDKISLMLGKKRRGN